MTFPLPKTIWRLPTDAAYMTVLGDLWDFHAQGHYVIVPVNLQGVHGRGLAKQAKDKGLIAPHRNRRFSESPFSKRVLCVAVKGMAPETARVKGRAFSERVTGANTALLHGELSLAVNWWLANAYWDPPLPAPAPRLYVPFIGLGFGEGDPHEILPLVQDVVGNAQGVWMVQLDKASAQKHKSTLTPGVRRDRTSV